jgi:hypothetical protein
MYHIVNPSYNNNMENVSLDREQVSSKWLESLTTHLPEYSINIHAFFEDKEYGFEHSWSGIKRAKEILQLFDGLTEDIDIEVIEHLAIFHDIGKFFEELHSLENINISKKLYTDYADRAGLRPSLKEAVLDGISGSDFYNYRLDPSGHPPHSLSADIFRAADKMLDNLVAKVDRYYDYGVNKRGATFFNPDLSYEERASFSFDNFAGDQLNVILSIIGLSPNDFSHPVLQEEYIRWSEEPKKAVEDRIVSLAEEVGETEVNIDKIKQVISWYRKEFNC